MNKGETLACTPGFFPFLVEGNSSRFRLLIAEITTLAVLLDVHEKKNVEIECLKTWHLFILHRILNDRVLSGIMFVKRNKISN